MDHRLSRRSLLPAAAMLAVAPASVAGQATPDAVLAEEQATRLLRRYVEEVVVGRNHDSFDTLVAEDIPAQNPRDADGRDALWQRLLDDWAATDADATVAVTIEDLFASGSRVAARLSTAWDVEYLDEYDTTGDLVVVAHVADGRIARLWAIWTWYGER